MGKERKAYTAVYEPAGEAGWWTVQISEVPGCISQGRSIAQARARVREALGLFLDVDESKLEVSDELRLPRVVQRTLDEYRKRREAADRTATDATLAARAAVRALVDAGMSTRDAGEALGVSQTRIAQIAAQLVDEDLANAEGLKHAAQEHGLRGRGGATHELQLASSTHETGRAIHARAKRMKAAMQRGAADAPRAGARR